MRRTRNRYYTIDAQNEEEFIKEYDNMKKSRLSEMNFKQKSKEDNPPIEQEEESSSPTGAAGYCAPRIVSVSCQFLDSSINNMIKFFHYRSLRKH